MSYSVSMIAKKVECSIPLSDIAWLKKTFERILLTEKNAYLTYQWEEDGGQIKGKLKDDTICLNAEQEGIYKNSSDGGLSILLEKYNGNGIIEETGEDEEEDEGTITKYVNGKPHAGKVVFDEGE